MPNMNTTAQFYCDGEPLPWSQLDRGLEFGDGLFETLKIVDGEPQDWDAHCDRLEIGCRRLALDAWTADALRAQLPNAIKTMNEGVLKLIISRGQGGVGYSRTPDAPSRVYVVLSPPRRAPSNVPWRLGLLSTPLMRHPVLGGLKTLQRLDSVLARIELEQHPQWHDGLMSDGRGAVISTTLGNIFLKMNNRWTTPQIDDAGIAGCVRRRVLELWPFATLTPQVIAVDQLSAVQEAFVTNSLVGVLPVSQLGDQTLTIGTDVAVVHETLTRFWASA